MPFPTKVEVKSVNNLFSCRNFDCKPDLWPSFWWLEGEIISTQTLSQQFYGLTPEVVLLGLEQAGYQPTGQYIQLNSYENRVFDVFLEGGERIITKYYRPLRWSESAILEEHFFLDQLRAEGIQVISPVVLDNGKTVLSYEGIFLSVFPKAKGRLPQELFVDDFEKIGRSLARIHNVGEQSVSQFRKNMTAEEMGWPAFDELKKWVAPEVYDRYFSAAEKILGFLDDNLDPESFLRIHGDCHRGNLLFTDEKDQDSVFFFIDFDDFCNGPPAQDFWMLLPDSSDLQSEELDFLLKGYEQLRNFDDRQLELITPLRGLRIIHYAAWIARRWEDPSFPRLFPHFRDYIYWVEEVEALEQIAWSL